MELIRHLSNATRGRGCVLTIGNFDGVHRGHQALLARTRALAAAHGVPATVMVFEPTPREFFGGGQAPGRLSDFRGRLRLLARHGADRVVCLRFGRALSQLPAETFVEDLLVRRLGVRAVVIGDDFRFGAGRTGDLALLQRLGERHGFGAEGLGSVCVDGVRCSSTAIRAALAQPDLSQAAALLGAAYAILGRVRRGLQLGRKLGMPTANLSLRRKPALRQGVYVVQARVAGEERWWPGVASLGVRPTLGLSQCLLETHLLGAQVDLYGRDLEVRFRAYLRPELRFESLDALAAQMQDDARAANAFFARNPLEP